MLTLDYKIQRQKHHIDVTLPFENEHLKLVLLSDQRDHEKLHIQLIAKVEIELIQSILDIDMPKDHDRVLINGYQSWTDSPLLTAKDRIKPLSDKFNFFFKAYGDYGFAPKTGPEGIFNSYDHILSFNATMSDCQGYASLNETNGYTIFSTRVKEHKMLVYKDVEGKKCLSDSIIDLYDLKLMRGSQTQVHQGLFPEKEDPAPKISGWTSWYNYYTKITEPILRDNLEQVIASPLPLEVFQIDDGYQTKVGDWLSLKDSFKPSMAPLVERAHQGGLKAGLWLSPFVAENDSKLYKDHPDWFIQEKEQPLKAGWNPGWSGNFYTLDIYHEEVIHYLEEVFNTVRETWGFNLVKLDFLYAIAQKPRKGLTRAELMKDGVQLLRRICGDMTILGCGVPLASARDDFEYCRIGSDVAPYWEDRLLSTLHYRERVSTKNSLISTIGRHMLGNHYFGNDPDVFIMRDEGNKMTFHQKKTLLTLNMLLGQLIFTSDCVGSYDDKILSIIKDFYPLKTCSIHHMYVDGDLYHLECDIDGKPALVLANLGSKKAMVTRDRTYTLEPFETKIQYL